MALTNTIGIVARDPVASQPQPDSFSTGAYGELVIGGGTAFTSAQHPNAEVVDGTGVTLGRQFRVAGAIASGTLQVQDAGDYLVELELSDHSEGAASGNIQYTLQYAPDGAAGTFAAFSTVETAGGGGRLQTIALALTTKERLGISGVQRLNGGGAVRAIVTSAAGDVCTITEGRIRVTKVADVDPPSRAS